MKHFKKRESNYKKATKIYKEKDDLTSAGLRFLGAAMPADDMSGDGFVYEIWAHSGTTSRLMIGPCAQYGTPQKKMIKKSIVWLTLGEYIEAAGKIVPDAAFIKSATERKSLPKFSAVGTAQQHYLVCQAIFSITKEDKSK